MSGQDEMNEEYSETFEVFQNPMQDHVDEHLKHFSKLFVVKPHGYVTSGGFEAYHPKHLSYPCKESDIWVASFAKCGTTWTQELVWSLTKGLDHPNGTKPLMERFPFFEWDSMLDPIFLEMLNARSPTPHHELPGGQWKVLEAQEDPRLIKTHLFYQLLPRDVAKKGCKIVYVVRDPRDACVSLFYHTKKFLGYTGEFTDFVNIFIKDTYQFGPFWANILGFWNQRKSGNILFLTYEDMKKDLAQEIRKVAKFLNQSPSEEYIQKMVKHLSFDSMKNNAAVNNESITAEKNDIKFMRKGIVGDYKNHLTDEHMKMFKEWTERWLEGSDFPYYRN